MPEFDDTFWENEEELLWSAMVASLMGAYFDGVKGGVNQLPLDLQVLVDFDQVSESALEFAERYRAEIFSGIIATTRKRVDKAVEEWKESGEDTAALAALLAPIFGEIRIAGISVTEITRIFAFAGVAAWVTTGFIAYWRWKTSEDSRVCPICEPLKDRLFPISDTASLPPNSTHAGCRCWDEPVTAAEALLG